MLQFGSKRSLDQFILWTCVPKDMWIRVPKVSKVGSMLNVPKVDHVAIDAFNAVNFGL